MDYLAQRHPLYWMNPNLKKDQIRGLIERLKFRMKGPAKVPLKQKSDLNNNKHSIPPISTDKPSFKSGGSLPSVADVNGKENKSKVKFMEPEFDEDEEEYGSEFDANELLDLSGVKDKRKAQAPIVPAKPAPKQQQTFTAAGGADEAWDLESDGDGWGEDDLSDLKKFDYKNTDLNKMSDFQIQRHK